ncbi:50S ribosomal protein L31 [bacterium]|nr:50S ribosomal protein L31 [bacterium]
MKAGIHPKYNEYDVILTTGEVVKMRSTLDRKEPLKLDIDPNTHPAWTGKRNVKDIGGGAADKFKKKFAGFTTKKA